MTVTRVMRNTGITRKSAWRVAARKEWGPKWWEVHPVIKRARIEWALQNSSHILTCEYWAGSDGDFRKTADALEEEGAKYNGGVHVIEADGKEYTC